MCGIVAYSGPERRSLPHELVRLLSALEYRGYDSAGAMSASPQGFAVHKVVGTVADLADKIRAITVGGAQSGMAHTRWATHGTVTEANAHPIITGDRSLAIAMNGVVENDLVLRRELAADGLDLVTASDTATLLALIEQQWRRAPLDLAAAVDWAMKKVVGRLAICVMSATRPDTIVVARRGSPLFVGKAGRSAWIASDTAALPPAVEQAFELHEGGVVSIVRGAWNDAAARHLQPCKRQHQNIDRALGTYGSYLEKEIFAQPTSVAAAVDAALGMTGDRLAVRRWNRIVLLGCGSAHLASMATRTSFERWSKTPTEAILANEYLSSDLLVDDDTLIIAVSQSGETADTQAASELARRQGATIVALTNAPSSSLARSADIALDLAAGPELSVASTKAYTAMLVRLTLLAAELGLRHRRLSLSDYRSVAAAARQLPQAMNAALASRDAVAASVDRWRDQPAFLFMGRGYDLATALEGSLKLRELSYRSALGIAAGELKHGTIAVIGPRSPVIALATDQRCRTKTLAAVSEVQARGADVLVVAQEGDEDARQLTQHVIELPRVADEWSPVVAAVPMQWLALLMATALERNVDRPRHLAKSVTVV